MQFKKKCICIIYAYHCIYEKNNVVNVVKNRHFYTNLFFFYTYMYDTGTLLIYQINNLNIIH